MAVLLANGNAQIFGLDNFSGKTVLENRVSDLVRGEKKEGDVTRTFTNSISPDAVASLAGKVAKMQSINLVSRAFVEAIVYEGRKPSKKEVAVYFTGNVENPTVQHAFIVAGRNENGSINAGNAVDIESNVVPSAAEMMVLIHSEDGTKAIEEAITQGELDARALKEQKALLESLSAQVAEDIQNNAENAKETIAQFATALHGYVKAVVPVIGSKVDITEEAVEYYSGDAFLNSALNKIEFSQAKLSNLLNSISDKSLTAGEYYLAARKPEDVVEVVQSIIVGSTIVNGEEVITLLDNSTIDTLTNKSEILKAVNLENPAFKALNSLNGKIDKASSGIKFGNDKAKSFAELKAALEELQSKYPALSEKINAVELNESSLAFDEKALMVLRLAAVQEMSKILQSSKAFQDNILQIKESKIVSTRGANKLLLNISGENGKNAYAIPTSKIDAFRREMMQKAAPGAKFHLEYHMKNGCDIEKVNDGIRDANNTSSVHVGYSPKITVGAIQVSAFQTVQGVKQGLGHRAFVNTKSSGLSNSLAGMFFALKNIEDYQFSGKPANLENAEQILTKKFEDAYNEVAKFSTLKNDAGGVKKFQESLLGIIKQVKEDVAIADKDAGFIEKYQEYKDSNKLFNTFMATMDITTKNSRFALVELSGKNLSVLKKINELDIKNGTSLAEFKKTFPIEDAKKLLGIDSDSKAMQVAYQVLLTKQFQNTAAYDCAYKEETHKTAIEQNGGKFYSQFWDTKKFLDDAVAGKVGIGEYGKKKNSNVIEPKFLSVTKRLDALASSGVVRDNVGLVLPTPSNPTNVSVASRQEQNPTLDEVVEQSLETAKEISVAAEEVSPHEEALNSLGLDSYEEVDVKLTQETSKAPNSLDGF